MLIQSKAVSVVIFLILDRAFIYLETLWHMIRLVVVRYNYCFEEGTLYDSHQLDVAFREHLDA